MYQVIENEETLQSWLSKNEDSVINTHFGTKKALLDGVRLFDTYYGTNRDLRADLGGFTILLFGDDFETEKHFQKIMEYFKLKENEYEYVSGITNYETKKNQNTDICQTCGMPLMIPSDETNAEH